MELFQPAPDLLERHGGPHEVRRGRRPVVWVCPQRGTRDAPDRGERTGYPPFGRLASLIISAGDRGSAEGFARGLAALAPQDERVQVLGPAEAPLAVIKGRYRFRLLVKSVRGFDLSDYLREWLAAGPKPKGNLKLEVDVDPQSFL